jgi:hypothetical protein
MSDITDPTLDVIEPVSGSTLAETPLTVFAATDDDANGVACQVDGASEASCDDAHLDARALAAPNGSHTIALTATDNSGRTTTATSTITVDDTTAPVVTIDEPSNGQTLTDDFDGVVSVDQSARVECRIDGGSWGACIPGGESAWHVGSFSEPFAFAAANGAHTVDVRAIDGAGNVGTAAVSFTVADVTAPALDVLLPGDGATVQSPLLVLPIGEPAALCEFSVDGGAFKACYGQSATVYKIDLGPGSHTVTVRLSDRAGNAATATRSVTVPSPTAPPPGGGTTPPPSPSPGVTPVTIKVVLGRFKVRKTPRGFKVLVKGKLVTSSGPATCPASVNVLALLKAKRVAKGVATPRSMAGTCEFQRWLTIGRRYAGKRLEIRVDGTGGPAPGVEVNPFGGSGKLKLPRAG